MPSNDFYYYFNYTRRMSQHSNAKGVAWVALVISVIALVFAWIAFNETGPSLDDRVESEVEQALETRQTQPTPTTTSPDRRQETNATPTNAQSETAPGASVGTTTDES
jgi:hypothetical protein